MTPMTSIQLLCREGSSPTQEQPQESLASPNVKIFLLYFI